MKRLISMLLVLTMVLTLLGGAAISAFASEEAGEESAVADTDADDADADDADADDADADDADADDADADDADADEVDADDADADDADADDADADDADANDADADDADADDADADDADADDADAEGSVDGSEEIAEVTLADVGGTTWQQASGFVAGQNYIIVVDGTAIGTDGTNITTTTYDESTTPNDSAYIWTASIDTGACLTNSASSVNLYQKASAITITTDTKSNWYYTTDGNLYYSGGGKPYYVSSATATSTSSSDAVAVTIYTSGTDVGTGTSSSGSSSSGGSSSGDSSSSGGGYASASELIEGYVVFSIDGYAFGFKENSFQYTTVTPASDGTVTAVKGNYMQVAASGEGYVFTVDDPPGTANYIYIDETGALAHSTTAVSGYWTYSKGRLAYNDGSGTTYYITGASSSGLTISTEKPRPDTVTAYVGTTEPSMGGSSGGSSSSTTTTVDELGPQIVVEPQTIHYVTEGSGYEAPTYSITVELPELEEGSTMPNNVYFQWYVNGEASGDVVKIAVTEMDENRQMTNTFTAEALADKEAGVYPVYCETYWKIKDSSGDPTTHTNTSLTTNFIVCTGVLENSFLTFSDVHETYENVGVAINDSITIYGGLVPALIICTGDWANGSYMDGDAGSDNYTTTLNNYIARLFAQVGGIDMVFVSGNHDNGAAAADATVDADLGADASYDGLGVIYDSNEDENAGSSAANDGLIVFGINYDQLVVDGGYSYANVLPELEAFLEDLSQNYNGELVVISAHAGLHVLGLQTESNASDWGGSNAYNVDKSDEMVSLLNKYADQMDIMFFFGHDHSKSESEFVLEPGDTIVSTISYADQSYSEQTIKFTYGHAGYITNTIGGEKYYSLVTWDDETILRNMSVAGSGTQNTVTIARVAETEPEPTEEPQVTEEPKPTETPQASGEPEPMETPQATEAPQQTGPAASNKPAAPKTGDETNISLYVVLALVSVTGLAVLAVYKRKENR